MSQHQNNIHKEFELERLILFSVAVFAIAITLLIIEIKFPDVPKGTNGSELWHLFQHTFIEFATFILSFFIIGGYWMRHLKLCRYLKNYDDGLIIRNLFFLFFIVVFPFSAASMGHFRPSFPLPLFIYLVNVFMLTISHFLIANYALKTKPHLTIYGEDDEKLYLLMSAKAYIFILLVPVIFIVFTLFSPANKNYIQYSLLPNILYMVLVRRWLKKYKPKKVA